MTDIERIRKAYSLFLAEPRVLLTGHSHQAWPDRARAGQLRYFDESARFVDDKWGKSVFPLIDRVGKRILNRLGYPDTDAIAFGKSTHELVFRLLSCFPLSKKPKVVTTTGEFHSIHRQLRRLEEDGLEVTWVARGETRTLAERMIAAIDERTTIVAISAVFFEDAALTPGLGAIIERAVAVGAVPLVDAYHAFNVCPLDLGPAKAHAWVTAGGYKYAQFGEGICFLRIPEKTNLRPAYTGWFADFASLEHPRDGARVGYDDGGSRFAGATFDPSAFYRADAVLDVFDELGLDVAALRALSIAQTERIFAAIEANSRLANVVTPVTPRAASERAGFVSLRVANAAHVADELRQRGVHVDSRGDLLRLGPAPYTTDADIERGVSALDDVLRQR